MGIREEVFYEGGPAVGDLIINLLLGLTVVGIPLAVGSIVRACGCATGLPTAECQ